jgi:hypothetical protein
LSLNKDAPIPREVQRIGRVLAVPILGGVHHQYFEFEFAIRTRRAQEV